MTWLPQVGPTCVVDTLAGPDVGPLGQRGDHVVVTVRLLGLGQVVAGRPGPRWSGAPAPSTSTVGLAEPGGLPPRSRPGPGSPPAAGTIHAVPPLKSMPRLRPAEPEGDQAGHDDHGRDGEPDAAPAHEVEGGLAVVEAADGPRVALARLDLALPPRRPSSSSSSSSWTPPRPARPAIGRPLRARSSVNPRWALCPSRRLVGVDPPAGRLDAVLLDRHFLGADAAARGRRDATSGRDAPSGLMRNPHRLLGLLHRQAAWRCRCRGPG